nr:hypothetical protein [Tanacetum cinerariifolium]
MSERVLSPQPTTQYNPITGEVKKETEKAAVVKENSVVSKSKVAAISAVDEKDNPKVSKVLDESNKAAVVAPVIEKVPVSMESDKETEPVAVADVKAPVFATVESVVEKDNLKVTSKVSDESVKVPVVKESVKVPVVKKSVKASSVVVDKPSSVVADKVDVVVKKNVKASSVVVDKPSSVLADKVDVVVKKSVKASSVVADKPSSVVADKVDVVKDNINVVADTVVKENVMFVVADKVSNINVVTGDKIEAGQFYPLELKKVCVNDIARKLIAAQEVDFLFKVNFPTLFTYTMGKADGLKGQICLDVVRRLREDSMISYIDWCDTFMTVFETDLIKKAEEKLSLICVERVMLEDYMRKASLKCPSDGKFVALHEKYVNLFKNSISFEDNGNGDNVGDDDDENGDDDGGNADNDANDGDGNRDEEDVNEGDKYLNGSNPSFGFSKISLEDFSNDMVQLKKIKLLKEIQLNKEPLLKEIKLKNVKSRVHPRILHNGDLFGDNSTTLEAMNQEITPEKLPTKKASLSPKKKSCKTFFLPLIPLYEQENKRCSKITRLEFILGNSLFAMQGDKMVIQSKAHEIHSESHVTHFESHSKSMFNGTLASFDAKWESFSNQVNAQFKGNKGGLALGGIDLYTQVAKVKHTIPKLKWKTKENFHDCGIFTMLHMETFDGGPASNLDCGLLVESQLQCDMLRRLIRSFIHI